MIRVEINGKQKEVISDTISNLLNELEVKGKFIAISINGKILPKSNFDTQEIADGDKIELFSPVGGG